MHTTDQRGALASNRIEALSDGVFAIAMTLLVLELHLPEVHGEGAAALLAALAHIWPKLVGFALGFILLGTLWVGHHYQFHFVRRSDRTLLWINLLFLLTISALPFAVALLGRYWASPVAAVIYGGLLLLSGSMLLVHWSYATSGRRLVAATLPDRVIRAVRARILLGMVGYGVGVGLAFVWPLASIIAYAVMPVLYFLPGRIDRHLGDT